jgi:hypothetical protein
MSLSLSLMLMILLFLELFLLEFGLPLLLQGSERFALALVNSIELPLLLTRSQMRQETCRIRW